MKRVIRFQCNLLMGSLRTITSSGAAGQAISSDTIPMSFKKTFHSRVILGEAFWPEHAPQPRLVGGVKGHNMKRNYLTGKPRLVAGRFQ